MLGYLADVVVVLAMVAVGATLAGLQGARLITRAARRLRRGAPTNERPDVPLIGVKATPSPSRDDDLYDCPRRLAALEQQLAERHRAVHQQAVLLRARQSELSQKGSRDELTRKYADDLALLERRAGGMRRVLGMVWKTRSILLARAHVAQTARRRPQLGRLPTQESLTGHRALRDGTATYHNAAAAVRAFLDTVDARSAEVARLAPPPPPEAEIDDEARAAVEAELAETRAVYGRLREDMDQLADNLTWLGDHYATLAVVEPGPDTAGLGAGPGELVREVEDALTELATLSRTVDPTTVDAVVESLAQDITRLEAAGLEAQAEADAELEIARLLRPPAGGSP